MNTLPHIVTFHGTTGWVFAVLAFLGAGGLVSGPLEWVDDRFSFRRFRVQRRWPRAGARLPLADGRIAYVMYVIRDGDAGDIACLQAYDSPEDDNWHQPEWVPVSELSPLPTAAAQEQVTHG
jgi:hypothetical protein